jgi:hypothetical protein
VQVDVDEECREPAHERNECDAPARRSAKRAEAEYERRGGGGEDSRAGVLPARRSTATGASTKKPSPPVSRKIAFQTSGPSPAANAAATSTAGRRSLSTSATAAAAAGAESAAP